MQTKIHDIRKNEALVHIQSGGRYGPNTKYRLNWYSLRQQEVWTKAKNLAGTKQNGLNLVLDNALKFSSGVLALKWSLMSRS